MKKQRGFTISVGELIDRLSIINIKVWHLETAVTEAKAKNDMEEAGKLAILVRDSNRERSDLREEINLRLEGRKRGTNKIEYVKIGRGE